MRKRQARGFTLFELALALIIILILVSMTPVAFNTVNNVRFARAEEDAIAMAGGILGTRDQNGMLGDLGYVPDSDSLLELARARSDFPPAGNIRGVTYGWHGPYALPGVGAGGVNSKGLVLDSWDSPWMVSTGPRVTIASHGPNRRPGGIGGLNDDILVPQAAPLNTVGRLLVRVFDRQGLPLNHETVRVDVTNPNMATLAGYEELTCDATLWLNDECIVRGLYQGQHAVKVSGLVGGEWEGARGYARVYVGGGTISAVSVRLTSWEAVP